MRKHFLQVVGRKTVILYSPKYSDNLYPHEGCLLSNTAKVDPENPDYELFPMYHDTCALQCNLSPGEGICFLGNMNVVSQSSVVSIMYI